MRRRLRIAFWLTLLVAPLALVVADRVSRWPLTPKAGIRIVTVNADTRPLEVAEALRPLEPDLVFMQEVAVSCAPAARALGLQFLDGSDQCLLSRSPVSPVRLTWPGPWQPPQMVTTTTPDGRSFALVNLRFAIPEVVAALATLGNQWYTEGQRRNQYRELKRFLGNRFPAVVCGDFNALPLEVGLSPGLFDAWTGFRYGATFPARLPAARIDQCWITRDLIVRGSWTYGVPSDHRALVIDLAPAKDPEALRSPGIS